MEPMDTNSDSDDAAIDLQVDGAPLGGAPLPEDLVLDDAECWPESAGDLSGDNVTEQTADARVVGLEAIADENLAMSRSTRIQVAKEEEEGGAAAEYLKALPELLQPQALTTKALKMFTGVARGPILSGDGKVLERFSLRVLKSIAAGIQPLNLKANAAVHESCGLLDDQEGRAFLAADLLSLAARARTSRARSASRSTSCCAARRRATPRSARASARGRRRRAASRAPRRS